jgi:hypothetical protein
MSTLAPTVTFAVADTKVAVTLPVRLPDMLVVEMKLELIVVAPAVFWTTTCGAEVTLLLPTTTSVERTCTLEIVLLKRMREVLTRTLAPTATLEETLIVLATTLPTNAVELTEMLTEALPMLTLALDSQPLEANL